MADKDGLKVTDMKSDRPVTAAPGYKLEDFASWLYFKDKWQMPGDFSIKADKKKYADYLSMSKNLEKQIKNLDAYFKDKNAKSKRKYLEIKGEAIHSSDGALEILREFQNK